MYERVNRIMLSMSNDGRKIRTRMSTKSGAYGRFFFELSTQYVASDGIDGGSGACICNHEVE